MTARKYTKLTDRLIESAVDFSEGTTITLYDATVQGLRIRIGRHRRTWVYFAEYSRRGKRGTVFRRLGFFPRLNTADARKAALQHAAQVAAGRPQPGRKDTLTLDAAATDYLESLKARGKKSVRFTTSMIRVHFGDLSGFTLAELSDAPALVRDWHLKISKVAPVSANRAASILNAIYRHASRLDRSLPPASPISGVRMNKEVAAQTAMGFDRFPEWRKAVEALPPIKQAYYRLMLLTGIRGGEAQRLEWSDIDLRTRSIKLRQRKVGADIVVPMSSAIAAALKLARPRGEGLIFPGARKWSDPLPCRGHALRHTWRTVAADLGVDELQARLLLGHSLVGISQGYVTRTALEGGPGLRRAQASVSRRMVHLLG